jgi:hypothetical protein
MFLAAFVAANARKASFEPSAGKELFDRTRNHRAQRPRSRIEALFVSPNIPVKVRFKQLIKSRAFGMSRTVLRLGFSNKPARGILICIIIGLACKRAMDDRLRPEGVHGRQKTSCGLPAAMNLIAGATFEPKHLWAGAVATEWTLHAKLDKLSPE